MIVTTAFSGFVVGFALIVAIGPQAILVLRQGLCGKHVPLVCSLCLFFDAVLISTGVAASSWVARASPAMDQALRFGGALFLGWVGARQALPHLVPAPLPVPVAGPAPADVPPEPGEAGRGALILALLGVTFLNPHAWLDTVVLLGGLSVASPAPWAFAGGAVLASAVFFYGLGYGARLLRPLFGARGAWAALDLGSGAMMMALAVSLLAPLVG